MVPRCIQMVVKKKRSHCRGARGDAEFGADASDVGKRSLLLGNLRAAGEETWLYPLVI